MVDHVERGFSMLGTHANSIEEIKMSREFRPEWRIL